MSKPGPFGALHSNTHVLSACSWSLGRSFASCRNKYSNRQKAPLRLLPLSHSSCRPSYLQTTYHSIHRVKAGLIFEHKIAIRFCTWPSDWRGEEGPRRSMRVIWRHSKAVCTSACFLKKGIELAIGSVWFKFYCRMSRIIVVFFFFSLHGVFHLFSVD